MTTVEFNHCAYDTDVLSDLDAVLVQFNHDIATLAMTAVDELESDKDERNPHWQATHSNMLATAFLHEQAVLKLIVRVDRNEPDMELLNTALLSFVAVCIKADQKNAAWSYVAMCERIENYSTIKACVEALSETILETIVSQRDDWIGLNRFMNSSSYDVEDSQLPFDGLSEV